MSHLASVDDRLFRDAFESFNVTPEQFDHAAHVRLAYIYLCDLSIDDAALRMKASLLAFLAHLGIGESKYHETITRAWVMAVSYFMAKSAYCVSAAEFMKRNPELLDRKIMLTHYSAEVLFSPQARQSFVDPNIQPIPPR